MSKPTTTARRPMPMDTLPTPTLLDRLAEAQDMVNRYTIHAVDFPSCSLAFAAVAERYRGAANAIMAELHRRHTPQSQAME